MDNLGLNNHFVFNVAVYPVGFPEKFVDFTISYLELPSFITICITSGNSVLIRDKV